jgi:hypothetical protein
MKLDFSDTYKPPLAFTQIIGPNGIGQLPVQSHSVVRQTLKERRPGPMDIELGQEQSDRLRSQKQRIKRTANRG